MYPVQPPNFVVKLPAFESYLSARSISRNRAHFCDTQPPAVGNDGLFARRTAGTLVVGSGRPTWEAARTVLGIRGPQTLMGRPSRTCAGSPPISASVLVTLGPACRTISPLRIAWARSRSPQLFSKTISARRRSSCAENQAPFVTPPQPPQVSLPIFFGFPQASVPLPSYKLEYPLKRE
ncbi:uncharacterized protein PHACADRAFT_201999 [Phanerochaete carnosa HHB-10118-sp]|uniref:Uncharacterized protein n=1 Tax=Phanerochaete carnosa (strain HHB-10118-sp) TaxID=650164 RepID=K5UHW4_PHACS|nr:uncharacterized protein PHACADRAFT_201999 [Phanerochaete carnosa HHB-10118-sp]EKM49116.1 hypothetical protein PHACADRAFT_201999 [Phanerochaete carnosa HHB-10118-sp]